jgi:hypothetical protein
MPRPDHGRCTVRQESKHRSGQDVAALTLARDLRDLRPAHTAQALVVRELPGVAESLNWRSAGNHFGNVVASIRSYEAALAGRLT